MKIAVIIQARMTSTRLPGKIMMDLCGKSVLEHLVDRVRMSKYTPLIIIATTTNEQDDVVALFTQHKKVNLFRGSEEDVLERYYLAASKYQADIIVRITSDCPLYDVNLLDQMLDRFIATNNVDYMSNGIDRTFPRGLDTEIFTYQALEKNYREAVAQGCREHVTPYIYQNPQLFRLKSYIGEIDLSEYRWTLDTKEDFELIEKIYNKLYKNNNYFGMKNILAIYKEHPEWREINKHVEQKKVGDN